MNHKHIRQLYLFCQIVEAGNYTTASKITESSVPTLSRTVNSLETKIGEKLIHRHAKQFELTTAGERYYQKFAALFMHMQEAWQEQLQIHSELSGNINIACTVPFAELFLQKQVIEFMQQHPKVSIKVTFAQDTKGFIDNKIDLAIVNYPPTQNHLIQKRLFSVQLCLVCSKQYLKKHGTPQTVQDLTSHHLLSGNSNADYWEIKDNDVKHTIAVEPRYQIDNFQMVHDAVVAGLGICLMPTFYFTQLQNTTELVQVLPNTVCPINNTYVVWSDRKLVSKKVSVFREQLFKRFESF